RFFGVLWRASPRQTFWWWALVAARGLLPAAFAVTMGIVVQQVGDGDPLGPGLAAIGVLFIAGQTSGAVHDAVSSNLGARTASWLHDRLLDACNGAAGL